MDGATAGVDRRYSRHKTRSRLADKEKWGPTPVFSIRAIPASIGGRAIGSRPREASDLIVPHDQYCALGRSEAARREVYRELFRARLETAVMNEIRLATNGGFVLGGARF
jgi:hypothetical protein